MTDADALELARRSLAAFAYLCIKTDRGARLAAHCDFHRQLVATCEAVESGAARRQLVICPPGHGKSTWISVAFPAWYLGRNPTKRVLSVSHAAALSTQFSQAVRKIMASPLYQAVFPGVLPAVGKEWRQASWTLTTATTPDPSYAAIGVGGSIPGRRCDLLLFDDLVDRDGSRTARQREKLSQIMKQELLTRLVEDGAALGIGHRWQDEDLYAELAADGWPLLHRRPVEGGAALWPEVWPVEALERKRREIGERIWQAQWEGDPHLLSVGGIFKREWWQYIERGELPPLDRVITYWDLACSAKTLADYSAKVTLGVTRTAIYVLSAWRGRLDAAELERQIVEQARDDGADAVHIEDATGSKQMIQLLQRRTRLPIVAAPVHRDKVGPAEAASVIVANKHVHLVRAAWNADFVEELEYFCGDPDGVDDWVDAFTGAMGVARFAEPRPLAQRRGDPLVTGRFEDYVPAAKGTVSHIGSPYRVPNDRVRPSARHAC